MFLLLNESICDILFEILSRVKHIRKDVFIYIFHEVSLSLCSSKSGQDVNPDLDLKEVTTSVRAQQEIAEDINQKEKGKHEDTPEVKVEEKMKEESVSSAEKETEEQEVAEEEEQLTGSTSADMKDEETMRAEKEDSSEDGLENRWDVTHSSGV